MRNYSLCCLAVCCWSVASACGSRSSTFRPFAGQFPTRQELLQLNQAEPATISVDSKTADVESYTPIVEPPPEPYAAAAYDTAWSAPLVEVANAAQGRIYASAGMRCLAEELGRFHLAHGANPSADLMQHLAAHCGVDDASPGTYYYGGGLNPGDTAESVANRWGKAVRDTLEEQLVGGVYQAGLWFGEQDGQATFFAVYGKRRGLVSAIERAGDRLVVRGQSLEGHARVRGMVTRGVFGYDTCEADESVRLPRFVLTCRVDPADAVTWIEIAGFHPGRFLGDRLVVQRVTGPDFDPVYRATAAAASAGSDYESGVLEAINALRAEAGLQPVALDGPQSETNRNAAPHYYAGVFGVASILDADRIALGLMAGWDIEGPVARGYISTHWQQNVTSPAALVRSMVALPYDRETLLNPRATRIAIGSVAVDKNVGMLITSYELLGDVDRAQLAQVVVDRINAKRAERGLASIKVDAAASAHAARAAQGVEDPGVDPDDAVQAALAAVVQEAQRGAQSWVIPADDLATIEIPEDILTARDVTLGLSVALYRDPSSPWGLYYALIYVLGGGQQV